MQEQRFLGEILARRGVVPLDRLEGLYAVQREKGTGLVDLIVHANLAEERFIAQALAAESELPYVERIEPDKIPTALATRVPIAFSKSHRILVIAEDDAAAYVLVADPFDTAALDDVRVLFGKPVEASVAGGEAIEEAINRVYERVAGGASFRPTTRSSTRRPRATSSTPTTRRRSSAG